MLAVSKTFGPDAVRQALAAGQRCFGENYVQEGVEKILALRDASVASMPMEWHCIGPLQSNKTRLVAAHFDWVQSVDRLKIAERLSEQRPDHLPPLQVCFSHEMLGPPAGYREAFGCPVVFGQAFSGLLLDNAVLDEPLPQANPQLAHLHEQYARAQLSALSAQATRASDHRLDEVVRQWVVAHLPQPRRADMARALGLGERTLGRRLQALGTSFDTLVDEVRRERALHLVKHTDTPMRDVAQALGFAELSPFYRAYARWTGSTPVASRRGDEGGSPA